MLIWFSGAALQPASAAGPLGVFEDQRDVGTVLHPGKAGFDAARNTYTVTGSGENMWFGMDDFHFVWKKVSGDVALSAEIGFVGAAGNNHRKAVLMIRQSLEGNAASVDIAQHGDGLTSLQFREAAGADTHEVETSVLSPKTVRIIKRGDDVYAFVTGRDGRLEPSGAATKLKLSGDFYVGIGVSSHDAKVSETATFTNVRLEQLPPASGKTTLYSTLETTTIASTDRRVGYVAAEHFEAPNWPRDGGSLLFNGGGLIHRIAVTASTPIALAGETTTVPTAPNLKCNNDHGLSADGRMLAISDSTVDGKSRVYILPVEGGAPRQLTPAGPSYWHGWSPDGKTIAFTGQRDGEFDIYTLPAAGGAEQRLTTAKGLDDGPEYAPDGQWIYFNSERTGSMQIWRMKPDGSSQEQVLQDETNDWFPHISPDGQWMVYLEYEQGVSGHPPNKDVRLMLMAMSDRKVHVLAKLFGGQGTINVPSWSPDSKKLAFVSYAFISNEDLTDR